MQVRDFFYSLPTRQNIYLHPNKVTNLTKILEDFTHHVRGEIIEESQNEDKKSSESETTPDKTNEMTKDDKKDQPNKKLDLDEFLKDKDEL